MHTRLDNSTSREIQLFCYLHQKEVLPEVAQWALLCLDPLVAKTKHMGVQDVTVLTDAHLTQLAQ
jgi:hypothetical protein